ncbi:STM4011 family radical SAM protein [Saccharibacillus sp. CPCC 101409]|uniref:STM4011 family radical SAM protein n=1 Tax=Saccharibacillus sp. CPCC 101409 TaxID=3058041 RepID=UPI0026713334|nr:STM4011 family radical SAM protein [Saccharibacillus sp. CPCC 101409]MDO3409555.1 STM4011 family radical SAM protein [Saccharibacillus sp. CPCC 101409]
MNVTLYFRGSLSSCNYACPYCPFSKTRDSAETLEKDRLQVERFVQWAGEQEQAGHRLSIFFNPYGEGLVHRWYREAMIALSRMTHVHKVAIQTNLSAKLDWTDGLNAEKVSFWATYHPGETTEDRFLARCSELHRRGIPFSVGSVGVRSAFGAIASLRRSLPPDVYLWINAFKDRGNDYYSAEEIAQLREIDPLFALNLPDYDSLGRTCLTGESVFFVQGSGRVKRCYSDRRVIGHLYRDGIEGLSAERPCGMKRCGCYIGYIHMPELELERYYGKGLLERRRLAQTAFEADLPFEPAAT